MLSNHKFKYLFFDLQNLRGYYKSMFKMCIYLPREIFPFVPTNFVIYNYFYFYFKNNAVDKYLQI